MKLEDEEVHIWRYTLDELIYFDKKNTAILSIDEKERSECFVDERDKIKYCCNRQFVRQVLSRYLHRSPSEIEIAYQKHGKPYLANANLSFNYSYRNNYCLLAVTNSADIGIDIEFMKALKDAPTFISFCFSEKEKEIIYKNSETKFLETLFTFWTFKEAIIKSIGIGLNTDISQIDLSSFLNSESNCVEFDQNHVYTLKVIDAPIGYKAAFAMKGRFKKILEFNYR